MHESQLPRYELPVNVYQLIVVSATIPNNVLHLGFRFIRASSRMVQFDFILNSGLYKNFLVTKIILNIFKHDYLVCCYKL